VGGGRWRGNLPCVARGVLCVAQALQAGPAPGKLLSPPAWSSHARRGGGAAAEKLASCDMLSYARLPRSTQHTAKTEPETVPQVRCYGIRRVSRS